MPLKGLAVWIAALSLLFSSGCSLVVSELVKAGEKRGQPEGTGEPAQKPGSGEGEEPAEPEEDLEAQPPVNGDGGSGASVPGEEGELSVSDLALKTDGQDWQEADREHRTESGVEMELTLLTPGGEKEDTAEEMIIVCFYKGVQGQVTTRQFAQKMMEEGISQQYDVEEEWSILEEKRNDILAEVNVKDGAGFGYARFLTAGEGIYALYYLAEGTADSEQEKTDWLNRVKRAGREEHLTL